MVAELQSSIQAEVNRVDSMKEEYEHYKGLASIEEKQARALMEQLQDSLSQGRGRERLVALAINIVAGLVIFILGVWLSPLIRELFGVAP